MKGFLLGLFVGIALLLWAIWHFSAKHEHVALVKRDLQSAAVQAKDYVVEKSGITNLTREAITDELIKTGQVVRRKAGELGTQIADATADPRKTATIKAKLLADQSLASLNISVHTRNGEVTLSGTATSADNISKAIKIALAVDGVTKVISTLKVKATESK
jgi:hypothetical protein